MPPKANFSEHELVSSICKESLYCFVKEFWNVTSAESPIWNWHIEYLCGELQKMAERIFKGLAREYDLIINLPPGTSKSTIFSIMFPAWAWTRMPSFKFIGASYAYSLAMELSRKCRDVVTSEKYRACFPEIQIREDQNSKGFFVNTHNGSRYSVGVNGSVMGMHAHLIGVDDPLDPEQSFSDAEIKIANRWMTHTLPFRKVDKAIAPIVLVQQRLRGDDPSGDALENGKRPGAFPIKHVRLPADDSFEISPPELKENYKEGLLDPVRLPRNVLESERARNEYSYVAQYGQDPRPVGFRMFEEEYFMQRVKAAPYQCTRIRYWDRASSSGAENPSACYTAGVLMAKDNNGMWYVEHVHHGQWEPTKRNSQMRMIAQRDRDKYGPYQPIIWVEREGGSSVSGKKEVRAEPWSAQLAAKNVYLVEDGTWDLRGYIEEHLNFPHGKLKDMVDSSSGAFNLLAHRKQIQPLKIIQFRTKTSKGIKLVVCEEKDLENYRDDSYCIMINTTDEPDRLIFVPTDNIPNLLDCYNFTLADVDPADYQDKWESPIEAYGKLPAELQMKKEDGRRMWGFILRPRQPHPNVVIFCERGTTKRAASLAMGVKDALGLSEDCVQNIAGTDIIQQPLNKHVRGMVKSTRNLAGP